MVYELINDDKVKVESKKWFVIILRGLTWPSDPVIDGEALLPYEAVRSVQCKRRRNPTETQRFRREERVRRGSPWRGRGGRGERRAARRRLAAAARVIRRVPFSVSNRMVPSGAAYRVSAGVRTGARLGTSKSALTSGGHSPHVAAAPQQRQPTNRARTKHYP